MSNSDHEEESYKSESRIAITNSFAASTKSLEKQLKIKILSPYAKIPSRATPDSIGFNLYASNKSEIPGNGNGLVSIGLAMTPPAGCYIRVAARSGLAINNKLQVGAGVIDPDYTGEVKVILFNHSSKSFTVKTGDKVAQMVLEQAKTLEIQILKYLKPTKRGNHSFGSSNTVRSPKPNKPKKYIKPRPGSPRADKLIVLPKLMERLKGCSFIGSKPSIVTASLGHTQGPKTEVIIDSSSNITLVSQKTIAKMQTPPKEHTGKKVTLSQVTAKTSIQSYMDLPLFFATNEGPVQVNIEAYVVKGMTTPSSWETTSQINIPCP